MLDIIDNRVFCNTIGFDELVFVCDTVPANDVEFEVMIESV